MLLTPNHAQSTSKRERAWLGIGLFLMALMLIALLWNPTKTISKPPPNAIFCDAENSDEEVFFNGAYQFNGLAYRNDDRARSGQYSIRLPGDGKTYFGFSTTIKGVEAGDVYEVSVWSFGNEAGVAQLVVQGREPRGLSFETDQITERDDDQWGLQKIRIALPFSNAPSQLAVYVYSNGGGEVFFDDLLIEKVQVWDSTAFQTRKLYLNVDKKAWRELENKREQALRTGILQTNEDDWVKAQLREKEQEGLLSAKIRLKGDWLDHLKGDKWSFRVKISDDRAWNGMNTFSLHTPEARYFLHEWLLHRFWKDKDVLTTRYDFIELILNGESKGIYAYEEHFAKQLIESQKRREGPIVKFSEDGLWASTARQLEHHGFLRTNSGHSGQQLTNAPITAFQEKQLLQDTNLMAQYRQAHLLLEQYRHGESTPDEIFDMERMAKYYAGCDLLNAYHAIIWHNQRFYYNPVTGLLEPIGFDGFANKPAARYHFLGEGALQIEALESESLLAYLLQDKKFVRLYIQALEKYSRPDDWNDFWIAIENEWNARLQWLQLEFPDYRPEPMGIANEVSFVRSKLLPFAATSLRAYTSKDGGLSLQNTHTLPLIIKGYGHSDTGPTKLLEEPLWLPAAPVRKLWTKLENEGEIRNFGSIRFWDQDALQSQSLPYFGELNLPSSTRFLFFQIPGWDSLFVSPIRNLPVPDAKPIVQVCKRASLAEEFPTLQWKEANNTIFIPKGKHTFKKDLIIDQYHRLSIEAGAEIDLQDNAAIICYGAVRAIGQESLPILIQSLDHTGQGLHVIQSKEASVIRMVYFVGLRNLQKGDWQLSGAVTFYESGVKIIDCRFLDNQSEDGLNIVRSQFEIDHCLFQNTSSDAFDSDFCKGTITNTSFLHTGNDGMDFSGSIITINDCTLTACGDKGISAGEASDITIINTSIMESVIGIASKDESVVYAKYLILTDCEQGLLAFQKKPEFGPASILVEGLTTENVKRLSMKGEGSRLQIKEQ